MRDTAKRERGRRVTKRVANTGGAERETYLSSQDRPQGDRDRIRTVCIWRGDLRCYYLSKSALFASNGSHLSCYTELS